MPSPYKRGKSGYSETDEADAKRAGELTRIQFKNLVDKGRAADQAATARSQAESQYKEQLTTAEGREMNRRAMELGQGEVNKILEINSRDQYESEKEAGDPNALRMSFAEWKKL